jgi:hypothetical protein
MWCTPGGAKAVQSPARAVRPILLAPPPVPRLCAVRLDGGAGRDHATPAAKVTGYTRAAQVRSPRGGGESEREGERERERKRGRE